VLLLVATATPARATDFEVNAQTLGQGYQIKAYDQSGASILLDRRRLTQYLGLNAFNILSDDWTGPQHDRNQLYFISSMRFDTDFGSYLTDAPTGINRIRELPQPYSPDQFQLLYAIFGGNNMFGFLDFQLGRQIVFDNLDFYSFDGLTLRARLPYWFAVEASGGLEVRAESPAASPLYQIDGVSPGSLDPATCLRLTFGVVPPPPGCPDQNAELAPTYGFALESWGIQSFHGRLAYRRTFSDTAASTMNVLPKSGVDEELLSYTLNAKLGNFRPYGAIRYNIMLDEIDEVETGIAYIIGGNEIAGEWFYDAPTWDGDSIFNVFATYPYDDLRLTWRSPALRDGKNRWWATGFARFFNDNTDYWHANGGTVNPIGSSEALGLTAGTSWQLPRNGFIRGEGYYEEGFGGTLTGVDVATRINVVRNTVDIEGRVTVVYFAPDLQKQNDFEATSFGLQAGARYRMAHNVSLFGLVEENNNRYYNYQLRALALLDLSFAR
jgi:hypothetical protein